MAAGFNDIFISYGRGNEHSLGSKDLSLKLHHTLEAKNFNVWLDNQDIPHAVDFQQEINEGIKSADNFIFIISPHSVASLYCMREIELAVELNKRIIPLLHIMPDNDLLEDSLHPIIKKLNWIYFDDESQFEKCLERLEEALITDQAHLSKHTDYTTKAMNWRENNRNIDFFLFGSALKDAEKWLKEAQNKQLDPIPSAIQKEYITKSRKYNNFKSIRRIVAVIVFILVSSTLSLALYFSQQQEIAAKEALRNISLANSNELIAKANTIQCEESVEMGLRIAALAYEADTTNEMAKTALYDTFYKTFKGDVVEESSVENLKEWTEKVVGSKGDFAVLMDANHIDYHNSNGEKLATFKSDKNFIGLHYDADKQIIYAKTDNDEVVTYHLKAEWVLKNIEKRAIPDLNDRQLERYGIKKDLYKKLDAKLQRFKASSPKDKVETLQKNLNDKQENAEEKVNETPKNTNLATKDESVEPIKQTAEEFTNSLKNAFRRYQNANENERYNRATALYNLAEKAYKNYPENKAIERAMITGNAYLANEYTYKNMPDSAIELANTVLKMDAKQKWVNKIKILAHLQKNEFDEAVQLGKPLLDENYPLAEGKMSYSELLEIELDKVAENKPLNQSQRRFKRMISFIPIEVSGFLINDKSPMTTRREVSLKIYAKGASEMMVSNTATFSDNPTWETFKSVKNWKLLPGQGKKTVFIKFRNNSSEESKVFQQSILLSNY